MVTKPGSSYDGTYYFVYDPTASIPAVVYEQGPTSRCLNIREPDGALVSRETYDPSGIRTVSRTYHFDGLGSTMVRTDETGTDRNRYRYDAWGNVIASGGGDRTYMYVGQYGYYTHYQEPGLGLLQLGVRYYDPTLGRFTQRDPLAMDSTADTLYAGGNPLNIVDPDGRKCRDYSKSPTVKKCWKTLDRCLSKMPFYPRAKKRMAHKHSEVLMCDGDGSGLLRDATNGDTKCWGSGKDMHCTIRFFNDSVFRKGNKFCKSMLHELLHVGNWPRSDQRADENNMIANAAEYLWSYLCDKTSRCYHRKHPWDWSKVVDPWIK